MKTLNDKNSTKQTSSDENAKIDDNSRELINLLVILLERDLDPLERWNFGAEACFERERNYRNWRPGSENAFNQQIMF